MAGQNGRRRTVKLTVRREPSEDALVLAAVNMLREIDAQRATCVVQRIANEHGDNDQFEARQGPDSGKIVTYAERLAELDRAEETLLNGLPEATREKAKELAGLA